MSYLVLDTADDTILGECVSAKALLTVLEQAQKERLESDLLVVRLGEHQGELVSTQSLLSVRALSDTEGLGLWRR